MTILPILFHKTNIILITKPTKLTKGEHYRMIFLIIIETKILNQVLANEIQWHIKELYTMTKTGSK